ncbi:hypothetical protein EVAR_31629_1 [Eumeta japonica]|uniref:Uncharacterized protein n=1 Tax=Eumeta variegata TaxID=151549 RepID=A0A4C1W2A0_EUMVA|nr:hypothetical protein EVAR_31629_1 [Eumeta japonica]
MHLQTELGEEISYKAGDVEKVQISAEAEMLYYELIKALEEEEKLGIATDRQTAVRETVKADVVRFKTQTALKSLFSYVAWVG